MAAIFFYERGIRGPVPCRLAEEPSEHYQKTAFERLIEGTKRVLARDEAFMAMDDLAKRYPPPATRS